MRNVRQRERHKVRRRTQTASTATKSRADSGEKQSESRRGKFFGIPLLFFINIPEVVVDGQRLSREGRITPPPPTHTHEALGVGNTTHTQCNPDTPLSIRSIDYTGRDKGFQRVLFPLSLLLTAGGLIIWHVRELFEPVWGKYKWWQRMRATSIYQQTRAMSNTTAGWKPSLSMSNGDHGALNWETQKVHA